MTNAEKFKEVFGFEADMKSCPIRIECEDCERCPYYQKGTFEEECARRFWLGEYKGTPTIPLSVIEKIKAEIDKHKLPCCFKDDRGYTHFLPNVIKVDDVLEIIDKAVKEIKYEHSD